jgi:hypothetical protein
MDYFDNLEVDKTPETEALGAKFTAENDAREEEAIQRDAELAAERAKAEADTSRIAGGDEQRDLGDVPIVGGLLEGAVNLLPEPLTREQYDALGTPEGEETPIANFGENLAASVIDFVDGSRDREQILEDRRRIRGERLDEINESIEQIKNDDSFANQATTAVADTLVRAVPGAALGMAENTLEFAEIVGDSAKSIVAQGIKTATWGAVNWDNENGTQNPFSDNYSWANWNLGRDSIGAQTPTGQLAQGLLQFVGTARSLGGFRQPVGVKEAFTAATTKAGKAKVILSAGAKEAAYGMATDLFMAAQGEGNLANLIENFNPALKDHWITALAVEEDDGPFQVAFKTAFEGAALGFPVGTISAIFESTNVINRLLRKGTDPEAAKAQGFNTFMDAIDRSAMVIPPNAQQATISRLMTKNPAAGQLDFDRLDLYETNVLVPSRAGVPTTWDDIRAVFPEYFESGSVVPGSDVSNTVLERITELNPGQRLTINPFTGEEPSTGFGVAIDGIKLEGTDQDDILNLLARYYDIFTRDDVVMGVEINSKGRPVLEVTRIVEDAAEAELLGRAFDQRAIYDFTNQKAIGTDGGDTLFMSKGAHRRSPYTVEPEIKPVDPYTRYRQQAEAAVRPQPARGGGGQRTLTNAQISLAAKSTSEDAADVLRRLNEQFEVNPKDLHKMSQLSDAELLSMYRVDLADFVKLDAPLEVLQKNAEGLLNDAGILQTRALVYETASTIADMGARFIQKTDEGIKATDTLRQLGDTLKLLMREHKVTANATGVTLGRYQRKIPFLNIEVDRVKALSASDPKINKTFELIDREIDNMVDGFASGDPKQVKKANQMANFLVLTGGDPSKMVDVTRGIGGTTGDIMLELMYNSLLSSPTTHLVNFLSNFFQVVYRPITAYTGGDKAVKKQAIASFYNFHKTVIDSWKLADQVRRTEVSSLGEVSSKRDFHGPGATEMQLRQLQADAEEGDDEIMKYGVGFLSLLKNISDFPLFNWPSKFLATSDEFHKVMSTRMEYNRKIMGMAIDEAGLDSGKHLDDTFNKLYQLEYSRHFTAKGDLLDQELLDIAKEVTFQSDLKKEAGEAASFLNNVPILKPFFPFVKTGHNVNVYVASHVPILSGKLDEVKAIMAEGDPYKVAVIKGRLAYGKLAILTGAMLATGGLMTGNGPSDPKRKAEWMRKHQPRSFRFGDKFVSYERMEPFGQILAATADLVYAFESGDLKEDQVTYLAGYLGYVVGVNLTDKSMFAGLEPLSTFLNPKYSGVDNTTAAVTRLVNGFVPLSGTRRATVNMFTPYMQEFGTAMDREKASTGFFLPFADRTTRVDWLTGEPIPSMSGGVNAWWPYKVTERGTDVVKDFLEDIDYDSSHIRKDFGNIDLTSEQTVALARYMAEAGVHADLKDYIVKNKKALYDEIARYPTEVRSKNLKPEDMFFYQHINGIVSKAKRQALMRLQLEYPDLADKIREQDILRGLERSPLK